MSINKDSHKAPNLRFKGFTDDWELRKFSDIVNRVNSTSNSNKIPKVEYEDIISGAGTLNKDISNKFDNRKGILFEPNMILYGKLRPYLNNWLFADFTGIALGDFWVFKAIDSVPKYIYYLIQSEKYQKVANDTSGTKMPRSDWKLVANSQFLIPKNEEQSKIGNFFKTLDDTITLHQRKLDQLNQLKAALLQQMFPGKGETVPKLRFADFNDEWEERKLGEMVGTISSGNRLPKSELTKGNVPYIVAQTKNNGVFGYISENTKDYNGNDMKLFPSNSISFSIDNPEAIFYRNEPFYTSNIMRVIHNETLSEFDYIFIIESMKMFTESYDWSRKFSGPIVSNLKIMFPMDNEEQLKIGQFFKQLDNTITLQQRKLEQLQNMKQVLLKNKFI